MAKARGTYPNPRIKRTVFIVANLIPTMMVAPVCLGYYSKYLGGEIATIRHNYFSLR
jgi:hypothetical protein